MNDFTTQNLEILKKRCPLLYEKISSQLNIYYSPNPNLNNTESGVTPKESFPIPNSKIPNSKFQSPIAVLDTINGEKTLYITTTSGKKIYIHSKYAPSKEAERYIKNFKFTSFDVIIAIGIGLGYLINELLKNLSPQNLLFIIEPSYEIFLNALPYLDLTSILSNEHVYLFVENDIEKIFEDIYFQIPLLYPLEIKFFPVCPAWFEIYENAENIKKNIQHLNLSVNINHRTLKKYGALFLSNFFGNLKFIVDSPGILNLKGNFKDIPAFLVAAGPSLNKNFTHLRKAQELNKGIVIAVDTALKPLLKHGIKPDIVVSVDPVTFNFAKFADINYSDIPLCFSQTVYPAIVLNHNGIKFSFGHHSPVCDWFSSTVSPKGFLEVGGSVATDVFSLAIYLECNPIILLGYDFCFSEGIQYTNGAYLENWETRILKTETEIENIDGGMSPTWHTFVNCVRWLDRKIQKHSATVINSSSGAKIKGTKIEKFEDIMDNLSKIQLNPKKYIQNIHQISERGIEKKKEKTIICEFLVEILSRLEQINQHCSGIIYLINNRQATSNNSCQKVNGSKDPHYVYESRKNIERLKLICSFIHNVLESYPILSDTIVARLDTRKYIETNNQLLSIVTTNSNFKLVSEDEEKLQELKTIYGTLQNIVEEIMHILKYRVP